MAARLTHLERWPIDRVTGRAVRTLQPRSGSDRINSALPVDPREAIPTIAARRGETLAQLSRMLSHDDGYLARYVRDGVPIALNARDHQMLADHFDISERALGIRDLWGERARGW